MVAKKSPTQLTIDYLYAEGAQLVQKVEVWNPFARKRKDLFDCWDVLAVKDGQTIAVQTTSRGNISARANKIAESESTPHLRRAGWTLHIYGWDKGPDKLPRVKIVDVS
jgi:hypothetical protein